MIQSYVITCVPTGKRYHGICWQEGKSYEDRVEEHLSLRKPANRHLRAAIEKYGREAFVSEKTGDYEDVWDARFQETVFIFRDHTWDRKYGFNIALHDQHRAPEPVCAASIDSLLDAAVTDFRNNSEEFRLYDTPANEALVREIARKEKVSVTSAFYVALDAGLLTSV